MMCFIFLVASAVVVNAADITPVGWWHFGEGSGTELADASGCGNKGTIHGAEWVDGIAGKELGFDGKDDYVECGSDPVLLPADYVTVSVWVKPAKWEEQGRIITKPTNPHGQNGYYDYYALFCRSNNNVNFRLTINKQDVLLCTSGGRVKMNEWNHIAATYNGACMKVYINDTLAGVNEHVSGALNFDSTALCLGKSPYKEGEAYAGLIDEVAVYNVALDSAHVHAIYLENRKNSTVIPSITLIPIASPTKNRRPEFKWNAVAGATAYQITIGISPQLKDPLFNIPVSVTSFTPAMDLPISTIFWRVKSDKSGYSQISSFVISDPAVPSLIPYEPKITVERKPTLKWHKATGATRYVVQIADNANFSNCREDTVADTVVVVSDSLPLGNIYWRVKSDANQAWSAVDHFFIRDNTVSTLIPFNGTIIDNLTPTLRWFSVTGAQYYSVQWDRNRDFSTAFLFSLSDTFFTVPQLPSEGLWYWRVKSDVETDFPAADSFIVKLTPIIYYQGQSGHSAPLLLSFKQFQKSVEMVISITKPGRNVTTVTLFDMSGRNVERQSLYGKGIHRIVFDKSALGRGVYMIQVNNGLDRVCRKLIVQ